jgi:hypothetical protein
MPGLIFVMSVFPKGVSIVVHLEKLPLPKGEKTLEGEENAEVIEATMTTEKKQIILQNLVTKDQVN